VRSNERKTLPSPAARTGHPQKILALLRTGHPPVARAPFQSRRSSGYHRQMSDEKSRAPIPPQLPGEAPSDAYGMHTGDGNPINPGHAVFPIMRYDGGGRMYLLGTGFFITTNGLFVTARHVLMDTFDRNGRQRFPIGIIQFLHNNVWIDRPILRCGYNSVADVAVGVAAPVRRNSDGEPLRNSILTLTLLRPSLHVQVVTYAYPKHANLILPDGTQHINFAATYYDGQITDYFPLGRDRVLLPGPCYQTSMIIHGGASGGPVFSPNGLVFGVNSTGFDGTDVSFVSRIHEIFALSIDDVVIDVGVPARSVSIVELAQAGHIVVEPPIGDLGRRRGLFES
jgi:hypothetical protein